MNPSELYGLPPSISRPSTVSSPRVLNAKYAHFFNELNRLAALKSNPAQAVYATRKMIQELLNRQMSPEMFVLRLTTIFGTYQPGLVHFLKSESLFSSPSVSSNVVVKTQAEAPRKILKSPVFPIKVESPPKPVPAPRIESPKPVPAPRIESPKPVPAPSPIRILDVTNMNKNENPIIEKEQSDDVIEKEKSDDATVEEHIGDKKSASPVPASPQAPDDPYVEPDNPLLNASAILKHCNRRKCSFQSITQEAVNAMAEYIHVEFRILMDNVIEAAKARQITPLADDEAEKLNDVKAQVSVLDSRYLSDDLKNATSDEAKKILASRNICKSDVVDICNDANETALAALGGRKRNWASSLIDSEPKPKNPYKPFRIITADVAFAMQKNKKLANSWAYRNTLNLSTAASRCAASKFL